MNAFSDQNSKLDLIPEPVSASKLHSEHHPGRRKRRKCTHPHRPARPVVPPRVGRRPHSPGIRRRCIPGRVRRADACRRQARRRCRSNAVMPNCWTAPTLKTSASPTPTSKPPASRSAQSCGIPSSSPPAASAPSISRPFLEGGWTHRRDWESSSGPLPVSVFTPLAVPLPTLPQCS